jgi:heterodisulfide reductase subunit A
MLSATGPYSGHLVKPSEASAKTAPRKIAWIQCVGSRDINRSGNSYCSAVCCMYAVKQALMAKEHSPAPLDCAVFYMDLRTQGKDFDRYHRKAIERGVRFIRSRVHSIAVGDERADIRLRYVAPDGTPLEEDFDMVVLSTGLQTTPEAAALAERLNVRLDAHRFVQTQTFAPLATSRPGIYACGAFTGPKDIPQSVMEASGAACAATQRLAAARHTRTRKIAYPKEMPVSGEPPRIGVFVCNCGINIGGVVDVPAVAAYAATLRQVCYVEENLFTCSQDTQDKMIQVIRDKRLNRVVIAACTPRTHEPLFQETLVNAGLNKYLLEMANIRNHDAWVHADRPAAATQKAKDLVRMAVAKAARLSPLDQKELPSQAAGLVVGGGIAGMTAALALARHGYPVHLVEKTGALGGNARRLYRTYKDEAVAGHLDKLIAEVSEEKNICVRLNTAVTRVDGFVGNFKTTIAGAAGEEVLTHGVAILATGASESRPQAYLYGEHPSVLTQLELDECFRRQDARLDRVQDAVFIQCVGSREPDRPYCSKVCCTHSLQLALELKARRPDANLYVLYRDIRTYGNREEIYRRARAEGVLFFQYDPERKPTVQPNGDRVQVVFEDPLLDRRFCVDADILCLAGGVEPRRNRELAQLFKVPLDQDGWLLEAHQKLRPVDFANDGVFVCGMAHYPKPIDESIAQAQAAAARALTILAKPSIRVGGIVADVRPERCSACGGCIDVCPFGACAAACPSEAITLRGFNHQQLYAQIKSAMAA